MVELLPLAREVRTALNVVLHHHTRGHVPTARLEITTDSTAKLRSIDKSSASMALDVIAVAISHHVAIVLGNPFQGMGFLFGIQTPWILTLFGAIRGMATHPDVFRSACLDSSFLWCPSLMLAGIIITVRMC